MADPLRCPVHGIPDCSPLLNGCPVIAWAHREMAGVSAERDELAARLSAVRTVARLALPTLRLALDEQQIYAPRDDAGETRAQAERVAWRVIKDWIAAQLAIVETQMVELDQVMLPYLHVDGDRTLYESYRDQELRAIGAS